MRYIKYFEYYNGDEYYTKLPHCSVEDILFDEALDITDKALSLTEDEIEVIVNSFKNFKFVERYPNIDFIINTKTRYQLGGVPSAIPSTAAPGCDKVQVTIRIVDKNRKYEDLILLVYKASDEWYYVATFGGDGDYKCDQMEGLLKFFEDLPKIADIYKEAEKIDESITEKSTRAKLESIVNMIDYLWSIDAADSLSGYYGACTALFSGSLDINKGWSKDNKLKPYEFNIDSLIRKLELSDYKLEERLDSIDELYKLSLLKRFSYTKDDIEEILEPVTNYAGFMGYKVISKIDISQHYNWLKRPTFTITYTIDEDELTYDDSEIKLYFDQRYDKDSKSKIDQLNKEFHKLRTSIFESVNKLDLNSYGLEFESCSDNTSFGDFLKLSFFLKEV